MFIQQEPHKLMSLLVVFLTENYETEHISCDECQTTNPRFDRVFLVNSKRVCIDCILRRIETQTC